ANCSTELFALVTDGNGKNVLYVKVSAFDSSDAAVLAGKFINRICDFLSISFNTYVKSTNLMLCKELPIIENDPVFCGELDWIDDN
ncbi:hypothetical protein, partial [Vibrio parahaemolyticus]